jgi:hypothetical protein
MCSTRETGNLKKLISVQDIFFTIMLLHIKKYRKPNFSVKEKHSDVIFLLAKLRNNDDMYIPRAVTDYVKNMPFFSLAINWNNLPVEKSYPNYLTFKLCLLDHLKNNW